MFLARLKSRDIITFRYLLGFNKMSSCDRNFLLLVALLATIPSFSQVCMQYCKTFIILNYCTFYQYCVYLFFMMIIFRFKINMMIVRDETQEDGTPPKRKIFAR